MKSLSKTDSFTSRAILRESIRGWGAKVDTEERNGRVQYGVSAHRHTSPAPQHCCMCSEQLHCAQLIHYIWYWTFTVPYMLKAHFKFPFHLRKYTFLQKYVTDQVLLLVNCVAFRDDTKAMHGSSSSAKFHEN